MSQDFLPGYGTPFRQLAPAASSACSQWPDSLLPHFSLVLHVGKRGHQGGGGGSGECGVEAEWVPWKEVLRAGCLQCEEGWGEGDTVGRSLGLQGWGGVGGVQGRERGEFGGSCAGEGPGLGQGLGC